MEYPPKKGNKKAVIAAVVVGAAVLVAVVLAVVLPIVNINRDFDALIEKMTGFDTPRLVITNMSAENNFSGAAGAMGIKKPYLIIERPQTALANRYARFQGIGANTVQMVGDMDGYFKMTDVRLDSVAGAADSELAEIKAALERGFIA